MGQKIKLDDQLYEVEKLSGQGKVTLASLEFVMAKMQELNNMQALLQRAKNSYIESIKQEMVASKAGFLLGND